ncbi:hypothetical protein OIU85_023285 [Salix viminalis]|uniref:Uncharacterized protein n=1 Tax=Salix viminalis TaxID=40686 RepID=A0A9Q0TYB7_SALVM|nr:hypothetical protein OIU85_023285 [Salix viminalis]
MRAVFSAAASFYYVCKQELYKLPETSVLDFSFPIVWHLLELLILDGLMGLWLMGHLAGERGNVTLCEDLPEDVNVRIQQHLDFEVLEKLRKQKEANTAKNSYLPYFQDKGGDDDDARPLQKMATRGRGKEVLCMRNNIDPTSLEVMGASVGDWVEDLEATEAEELSWLDVTITSERAIMMFKIPMIPTRVLTTEAVILRKQELLNQGNYPDYVEWKYRILDLARFHFVRVLQSYTVDGHEFICKFKATVASKSDYTYFQLFWVRQMQNYRRRLAGELSLTI